MFRGRERGRQYDSTRMEAGLVGIVDLVALDHGAVHQRRMDRRRHFTAPPDRGRTTAAVKPPHNTSDNLCPLHVGGEQAAAEAVQNDPFCSGKDIIGNIC